MTWTYIAGFFDGEGSITRNGSGFRITIPQTNLAVLRAIRHHAGYGMIMKVTKRQRHWRESWTYYIARQSEVQDFLQHTESHLIVKRAHARRILNKLKNIVHKQRIRRNHTAHLLRETHRLRRQGLTYRAIGSRLGIDFGYARRILLQGQK